MPIEQALSANILTDLLFEEPGVGRCLIAPDGSIVRVNADWLRSTGFALDEVLGADIVELFPATRDMALAMHARARAGHRVEVPPHAQRIDGRETWWEGSIAPVPMAGGTGLLITAREVIPSDRRAADDRLNASRLEALVSTIPAGVIVADLQGRFTLVNREARELLGGISGDAAGPASGYTLETANGAPFPNDELPLVRALRGEATRSVDIVARRADGSQRVLLAAGAPVRDEHGAIAGAIAVLQDISERKLREAEFRRSEERFRLLTEAMPQIVCVLLPDGTPEYVNITWTRYSGLDVEGTARVGWIGSVHPDDVAVAAECRSRTLKSLAPQDAELRYRSKDGTYRWFVSRLAPVVENGRVVRLVGAAMDIDDRKRAEAALRDSERRYRTMGETLPYGVWLCNPQGGSEYVSQSFLDLLEMTQEEQREFGWTHRLPPEEVQPMLDRWLHCVRTGTPWDSEHRVLGPDGRYHHVLTRGLPVRDDKGEITCWVGINLDIDDRKRTEAALARSEAAFEHAGKLARFGAWWVELAADGPAGEVRWSDEVYRIFGYEPDGVVPSVELWRDHLHPDDRARVEECIEASVAAGRPFELEHRIVTRGGAERVVAVHGDARIDGHHGTPTALIGAVQDVTERKRIEEELRDAGRRKDEFLGMLSHELRNPLAPIRNAMYVVRHAAAGSDRVERAHEVIERQTEHLTRLVDDLLDVTRIARGRIELRRSRIDLRDVVARTADDFRPVFDARGVRFSADLTDRELWADADATRLAQVVGNLLHNAAKFTRNGDEVALALTAREGEAELRVRDTGAGIEPALLPRVFDVFTQGERTLARSEGGLGLGLSLVKGIAELHGGSVRAESSGKGKGAEFTVMIPLLSSPVVAADAPAARVPRPGPLRVLVVDDNRDAADTLAEVISMLGHDVDVAYDGAAALATAHAESPSVILCDIGLPGMSGLDVARALRSGGRAVPLLVALSGYAQAEDVRAALEAGFDRHLAKPGTLADIEELLAAAAISPDAPRTR